MILAPPLALTMGEPAGIGSEITIAAWRRRAEGIPAFFAIADPAEIAAAARRLGVAVAIRIIADPAETHGAFDLALPVLAVPLATPAIPGKPDPANGKAVVAAIDRAVALVRAGAAAALVTNPIQKSALYQAGFKFPGHTEYLAHLAGASDRAVMMLVAGDLRVIPVTVHVPLAAAVRNLTTDAIVHHGQVASAALRRDFGIDRPRLAVAGLNPHAGEGGALGREEIEIIAPAVARLSTMGVDARGPVPADTLFHPAARRNYDAVLCMYHDQALIPLKTIDFYGGVNVTLGLPFIRTSPDHGTALDIAGAGRAEPSSLIAALGLAAAMAARRKSVMAAGVG